MKSLGVEEIKGQGLVMLRSLEVTRGQTEVKWRDNGRCHKP